MEFYLIPVNLAFNKALIGSILRIVSYRVYKNIRAIRRRISPPVSNRIIRLIDKTFRNLSLLYKLELRYEVTYRRLLV